MTSGAGFSIDGRERVGVADVRRVPDQRLAEERDRVEALVVDPERLGLGIGERGPRLAEDPVVPLAEGVAEDRVRVHVEPDLDEGAHRADARGRPEVEVEAARVRRERRAGALAGRFAARDRNRRRHEAVIRSDRVEALDRRHAHLPAELQGRVRARDPERAGEFADRDDVLGLRELLDLRLELLEPFLELGGGRRLRRLALDGLQPVEVCVREGFELREPLLEHSDRLVLLRDRRVLLGEAFLERLDLLLRLPLRVGGARRGGFLRRSFRRGRFLRRGLWRRARLSRGGLLLGRRRRRSFTRRSLLLLFLLLSL